MSPDTLETLRTALFDRYRVERLLGSGGMATVYLAHDTKHDRSVAIKVLRPELALALGTEQFLREIQIAARLTHPHVLPLHDSGEAGGLLYYVMPYVTGESLQDRLAREKQLPVDEAVRIVREAASALAYAHGQNIVHRDIKPGNILLSDGSVLVADFGLARAISSARSSDSITRSGLTIGTPTYMSPEQAAGEAPLDGRSDIYSLGCVLYELLAGDPPFTASNPTALIARHVGAAVVPIRTIRPSVPREVAQAIQKALEKSPADRYQKAEHFAAALAHGLRTGPSGFPRRVTFGLLAAAAVTLGLIVWSTRQTGDRIVPGVSLDTTRFAIFPFDYPPATAKGDLETVLGEALAHWDGVTLVERSRVETAVRAIGTGTLDEAQARRSARDLKAGRYLRGQVLRLGDSLQLRVTLYDGISGAPLGQKTARLPVRPRVDDATMSGLADALLFRGQPLESAYEGSPASHSFAAVSAYLNGRRAVVEWDLSKADGEFARALDLDAEFSQAALWVAQVRAWLGLPPRVWRLQAEQAWAGRLRLGVRDTVAAAALLALSKDDYASACTRWRTMTVLWPNEFTAWYGSAICQSMDEAVQRDPSSPSGWAFRTSYHQAQLAWRRAFTLRPTVYRDFRASGRRPGQRLLWTSTNRVRGGYARPPDSGEFSAFPSWQGDTIGFIPYPQRDFSAGKALVAAPTTLEAVRQQRRAFYDMASEWQSTNRQNPDAGEALGIGLWLLGNPSAPDTIHAARVLASRDEDRARLGVTEALMLVLQGAPDEMPLRRARGLIDSLFGTGTMNRGIDPWDLAAMAALTGRGNAAARLIRLPTPRTTWQLPPGLATDALALLAFASLGGPAESLSVLERRVDQGIRSGVDKTRELSSRLEWIARPATIAFLESPFASLHDLAGHDDYLTDAVVAYQAGDTVTVRLKLDQASLGRAWMQPWDLSLETLQPEARLLAATGDNRGAIERLDPTLSTLRSASLDVLRHPVGAGMLVRAMALRADLANTTGDHAAAARWARAVEILWSNADAFLQPLVARMRRFARGARA